MSDAPLDRASGRAPNVLLLITDQQRHPCHWPDDPGWLRELTPNDHRLAADRPALLATASATRRCARRAARRS